MIQKPIKAYSNEEFLNAPAARPLRIISEYLEPADRLAEHHIEHTVVFFGSARTRAEGPDPYDTHRYYHAAEETAYLLSKWSHETPCIKDHLAICTGGGPGIMEAANCGADRAGGKTIGLGISLPFEQTANPYISPGLAFEFHYFFMRKLWFLYHARALMVFPGGYGTLDELFETLTLVQTRKLTNPVPIFLFDRTFWHDLINFDAFVKRGLISPEDIDLINFFDTPQEGFDLLRPILTDKICAEQKPSFFNTGVIKRV